MGRINSIYLQIGHKIAVSRNQLGITQDQLAKSSGLSRTSIVLIEQGRQRITIDRLYQVANALSKEVQIFLPPTHDFFTPKGDESKGMEMSSAIKLEKKKIEILKQIILNKGVSDVAQPHKKGKRDSKENVDRKSAG
jgi:transcriptional regulator with XRE-family HTH domain